MSNDSIIARSHLRSPRPLPLRTREARAGTLWQRRPPRVRIEKAGSTQAIDLHKFSILCASSFVFWSVAARASSLGNAAAYALVAVLSFSIVALILRGRAVSALTILVYLSAVQPPLRQFAPLLPYLALNYLMLLCALLLFFQSRRPMQLAIPFLCYSFYILLETVGMASNDSFVYGRTVLVPSLTILAYLALAFKFRFDRRQLYSIFCAYIAGAVGVAAIMVPALQKGISWGTESSNSASGGMGGNQITLLLAVGAFMAFLCADEITGKGKLLFWLLAGALAYFMVLTFSRGGLYMLVAVSVLYYVFLKRPSAKTLLTLALFSIVGLAVFDITLSTTGGKVMERYGETTLTNRDRIISGGWNVFLDNMTFGVGTGNFYKAIEGVGGLGSTGAHNELIRAAAEHGIFGLASWVLFALSGLGYAAFGAGGHERDKRALRVTFFVFALLSMFYNGLKLLVQPILVFIAIGAFTSEYEALRIARRDQKMRRTQLKLAKNRRIREARKVAAAQATQRASS